jgi:hypothetical protein
MKESKFVVQSSVRRGVRYWWWAGRAANGRTTCASEMFKTEFNAVRACAKHLVSLGFEVQLLSPGRAKVLAPKGTPLGVWYFVPRDRRFTR